MTTVFLPAVRIGHARSGECPAQPVAACRRSSVEPQPGALCPFRLRNRVWLCREVVGENELVDSRAFGHAADLRDIGMEPSHPLQGLAGEALTLQVAEVGHAMNEDVGTLGEGDQVVIDCGVAAELSG